MRRGTWTIEQQDNGDTLGIHVRQDLYSRLRPPAGSLVSYARFERIVDILCSNSARGNCPTCRAFTHDIYDDVSKGHCANSRLHTPLGIKLCSRESSHVNTQTSTPGGYSYVQTESATLTDESSPYSSQVDKDKNETHPQARLTGSDCRGFADTPTLQAKPATKQLLPFSRQVSQTDLGEAIRLQSLCKGTSLASTQLTHPVTEAHRADSSGGLWTQHQTPHRVSASINDTDDEDGSQPETSHSQQHADADHVNTIVSRYAKQRSQDLQPSHFTLPSSLCMNHLGHLGPSAKCSPAPDSHDTSASHFIRCKGSFYVRVSPASVGCQTIAASHGAADNAALHANCSSQGNTTLSSAGSNYMRSACDSVDITDLASGAAKLSRTV